MVVLKDHSYFRLIAEWLIDMSRELMPSVHAGFFMVIAVFIYRWGRCER
jgi:hypothetical protein